MFDLGDPDNYGDLVSPESTSNGKRPPPPPFAREKAAAMPLQRIEAPRDVDPDDRGIADMQKALDDANADAIKRNNDWRVGGGPGVRLFGTQTGYSFNSSMSNFGAVGVFQQLGSIKPADIKSFTADTITTKLQQRYSMTFAMGGTVNSPLWDTLFGTTSLYADDPGLSIRYWRYSPGDVFDPGQFQSPMSNEYASFVKPAIEAIFQAREKVSYGAAISVLPIADWYPVRTREQRNWLRVSIEAMYPRNWKPWEQLFNPRMPQFLRPRGRCTVDESSQYPLGVTGSVRLPRSNTVPARQLLALPAPRTGPAGRQADRRRRRDTPSG